MNVPSHLEGCVADILSVEADGAVRHAYWAVVLKLVPVPDGDQWVVLYGENLQEGISGFGNTPREAMHAFDLAMDGGLTPDAVRKAREHS